MASSTKNPTSMLLRLPAEIRLAIYEHLLVDGSQPTISIRSEDPAEYARRRPERRHRTSYWIQPDPYRPNRTVETTYRLRSDVRPTIHTAILGVNRQLHAEAASVLYGSYTFDFGSDLESAIPFFQDLSAPSLAAIRRLNLVKRPWPASHYVERYKWAFLCAYIATHLGALQRLDLSVFGGKVDATRYIPRTPFSKQDCARIATFDGMEWVQHLLAIKGLLQLDIRTIWERCPEPCSNGLAFFVDFSASIENGFAEYLRENMVAGAA